MTFVRRPRLALSLLATVVPGCGDRAPPAMWPEPPPPTLAEPIGVERGGRASDRPTRGEDRDAARTKPDDVAATTTGSDDGERATDGRAGAPTEPAREPTGRSG